MKFARTIARILVAVIAMLGVCGAVTHVRGVQQSRTGNQDHRQYSWRKTIQWLNPDRTPFTQVLTKLRSEKVTDTEFKVFERDHPNRWNRINYVSGYNSSATSMVVDNAGGFRVGDIVFVPRTGERIKIGAVNASTNTLSSITRGVAGSTAAALVDDDWIRILYSAEEENGLQAVIITTATNTVTNFCQIFKRTWGLSNTRRAMSFRNDPHSLAGEKKLAMELLKEDRESAYLWGKKREEISSGEITRYTGGVDEFCTTNRVDLEGGLGFGDIGYLMNRFTRFGGNDKIWMCGRDLRQQMDSLGLEFRRVTGTASKLGFKADGFRSSFGDAMMTTHMGLDNALAGHGFVIDPAHARLASLRKFDMDENIQTPGRDGVEHQIIGEDGLWIDQELAHGVLYNATRKTR